LRRLDLCAAGDPLLERGDFGRAELLLARRHLTAFHPLEQEALARLAFHDGRAAPAALQGEALQAEVEAAFGLLGLAVAFGAIRLEDGPHVSVERGGLRRFRGERGRGEYECDERGSVTRHGKES